MWYTTPRTTGLASGTTGIEKEHPEHYDAIMATPANWNVQLPYYDSYGEKKINLTERMRRAKKKMAWLKAMTEGTKPAPKATTPCPSRQRFLKPTGSRNMP